MYIAMHTLVYADDPEAARAFFRDVLEWPHVDTGGGWLIFKSGPSELGVHPTDDGEGWSTPQKLDFSLVVDDLEAAGWPTRIERQRQQRAERKRASTQDDLVLDVGHPQDARRRLDGCQVRDRGERSLRVFRRGV